MSKITVLDQATINQIAAGEVVERPASVVKELIENAIDAKATAITCEIKDGGISLIRITDNGCGIEKEDLNVAFLRHSTSKIKSVEDLLHIGSLGFRGEALSSIAAVAQVELVTKTRASFIGSRYLIEGGVKQGISDIGCPDGTTFLVRNLFFNTPARRKFLKTAATEAGYVSALMERLAISHPEISFKFINNNKTVLHTFGNGQLKDILYHIYGRTMAAELVPVSYQTAGAGMTGFIGKPIVSRGNRNFENYFINGRYIKSNIISKAIEEAYRPYSMQHKYPFTALHFTIDQERIDVNVHPTKMEIRFVNGDEIYQLTYEALKAALSGQNMIPDVELFVNKEPVKEQKASVPEPFEAKRQQMEASVMPKVTKPAELNKPLPEVTKDTELAKLKEAIRQVSEASSYNKTEPVSEPKTLEVKKEPATNKEPEMVQESFLTEKETKTFKIIGQLFKTYWMAECDSQLYIIDQHAAHEKILYEDTMKRLKSKEGLSQMINPPIVLTLNLKEEAVIKEHAETLSMLGFTIEPFGGKEYMVSSVPADMFGLCGETLLTEFIDNLAEEVPKGTPDVILEKIASMSCKAAVKGNQKLSEPEARALIERLLTLDNPFHCPHGRPIIVSMTKYELEKKFKRIV